MLYKLKIDINKDVCAVSLTLELYVINAGEQSTETIALIESE